MSINEIRNKSPDSRYFQQFIVNTITTCDHKPKKEKKMKTIRWIRCFNRISLSALLILSALAITSQHAAANTASNTSIVNTATVAYKDAGGVQQTAVTSYATVTVTLVAAAPTLTAPADQITTLTNAATYSYTITSNANGVDTYALSTSANGGSVTNSANILTSSAVPSNSGSVTLGATTAISSPAILLNTDTVITVPSDGVAGGGVNGITAGARVVIGGLVYDVISVVDNANTPGTSVTSTITVNGPAQSALTYGTLIYEQKTISLAVTPLTMSATTTNETVTVILSAKGAGAAALDTTVTTVQPANLTVTKEVSLTGLAASWGATANAPTGTALFYRITVTNSGAANATSVVITDPLNGYVTYTGGSAKKGYRSGL